MITHILYFLQDRKPFRIIFTRYELIGPCYRCNVQYSLSVLHCESEHKIVITRSCVPLESNMLDSHSMLVLLPPTGLWPPIWTHFVSLHCFWVGPLPEVCIVSYISQALVESRPLSTMPLFFPHCIGLCRMWRKLFMYGHFPLICECSSTNVGMPWREGRELIFEIEQMVPCLAKLAKSLNVTIWIICLFINGANTHACLSMQKIYAK